VGHRSSVACRLPDRCRGSLAAGALPGLAGPRDGGKMVVGVQVASVHLLPSLIHELYINPQTFSHQNFLKAFGGARQH
jgi:hypothetical protein